MRIFKLFCNSGIVLPKQSSEVNCTVHWAMGNSAVVRINRYLEDIAVRSCHKLCGSVALRKMRAILATYLKYLVVDNNYLHYFEATLTA